MARALGVIESDVAEVEFGLVIAPCAWREQLIARAQDVALQALSIANNLLWRECVAEIEPPPAYAPPPLPSFA